MNTRTSAVKPPSGVQHFRPVQAPEDSGETFDQLDGLDSTDPMSDGDRFASHILESIALHFLDDPIDSHFRFVLLQFATQIGRTVLQAAVQHCEFCREGDEFGPT
jgi:hypothetical protein